MTGATGATGATGPQGLQGVAGTNGTNGQGVPTGGTANQVLTKVDGTDYNTAWTTPAAATPSQLEQITENGNTGYRILGRNPANYGDIGADAVDFSFSSGASTTRGATGAYNAFAAGYDNTASGYTACLLYTSRCV